MLQSFPGVKIKPEGRFEGRQAQLVAPQGAGHGVLADLVDNVFIADDDPCLGSAEQLVAAEGDQVDAGSQCFPYRWLAWQSIRGQVHQQAATEIFEDRNVLLMSKFSQLFAADRFGEAEDPVVAGVDLENKRRLFVDGVSVILEMGLVGGAHFNQFDTTGRHNVRDTERAADLDQLAT